MIRPLLRIAITVSSVLAASLTIAGDSRETAFLAENRKAMETMMSAMEVAPGRCGSGLRCNDGPHHQGAIDMARAELRHGHNEQLLALPRRSSSRSSRKSPRCTCERPPTRRSQERNNPVGEFADNPPHRAVLTCAGRAPVRRVAGYRGESRDRVYAAEQFSNTVSVTDPVDNKLVGVIRLGDPLPGNFSPLYRGQLLVHGMGFSPDHHTLVVVSIGSNSVTSSIPRQTRSSTSATSGARRTRRSSRRTPRRSGSLSEARTTFRFSTARASGEGPHHRSDGPGMQIFSPDGNTGTSVPHSIPSSMSCRWPPTPWSTASHSPAPSAPTSQRRRRAPRSGSP